MRKIIAGMFITLDGVMGAPNHWQMPYYDAEMGAEIDALMAAQDILLLGRRTYQEFAAAFEGRAGDPTSDRMNAARKVVVSNTLPSADWQNSSLIRGDVSKEIAALKQASSGTIGISGSATLVRSLLDDGLLDELHLLVHPIVLGAGTRLFEERGRQAPLTLVDAHTLRTGVVSLTYTPGGA